MPRSTTSLSAKPSSAAERHSIRRATLGDPVEVDAVVDAEAPTVVDVLGIERRGGVSLEHDSCGIAERPAEAAGDVLVGDLGEPGDQELIRCEALVDRPDGRSTQPTGEVDPPERAGGVGDDGVGCADRRHVRTRCRRARTRRPRRPVASTPRRARLPRAPPARRGGRRRSTTPPCSGCRLDRASCAAATAGTAGRRPVRGGASPRGGGSAARVAATPDARIAIAVLASNAATRSGSWTGLARRDPTRTRRRATSVVASRRWATTTTSVSVCSRSGGRSINTCQPASPAAGWALPAATWGVPTAKARARTGGPSPRATSIRATSTSGRKRPWTQTDEPWISPPSTGASIDSGSAPAATTRERSGSANPDSNTAIAPTTTSPAGAGASGTTACHPAVGDRVVTGCPSARTGVGRPSCAVATTDPSTVTSTAVGRRSGSATQPPTTR